MNGRSTFFILVILVLSAMNVISGSGDPAADALPFSGGIGSDGIHNLTVSPDAPSIEFVSPPTPTNGSIVSGGTVKAKVSVSDTDNVSVFFDVDDTLVSWWRMDDVNETAPGATIYDFMGRNDATAKGYAERNDSGYFGRSYTLNGTGNYIDCGHSSSLEIQDEITIEAWVKADSDGFIISKGKPIVERYFDNFETGFGNWKNVGGDDFQWSRDYGGTSSSSTGPNYDHTYGTTYGYYAYTESSSPNYPSKRAFLESPEIELTGGSDEKLEFYYHMYGSSMGTLYAQISQSPYSTWSTLWSRSGQQHSSSTSSYSKATISLSSYSGKYKLRFHGLTGSSFTSDMAIDDVTLNGGGGMPYSMTTENGGKMYLFGDKTYLTGGGDITDGKWHQVVGTYTSGNMTLYVDGKYASHRNDVEGKIPVSTNHLLIGAPYDSGLSTGYLNGSVDDIKIFGRCLTAKEVGALYSNRTTADLEVEFDDIPDGSFNIMGIAQDSAGNVNVTGRMSYKMDATEPSVQFESDTYPNGTTVPLNELTVNAYGQDAREICAFIDIDSTLVNWWRMDERSGDQLFDRMGNRDLTMYGNPSFRFDGYMGFAYGFDGLDDHMDMGICHADVTDATSTVVLSFNTTDSGTVIVSEGGSSGGWELGLDASGRIVYTMKGSPSDSYSFITDDSYNDGSWHHLIAVMTTDTSTAANNGVDLYMDGNKAKGTETASSVYNPPSGEWTLGAADGGSTGFFEGMLDDVMFFNRSLCCGELGALYPNTTAKSLFKEFVFDRDRNHEVRVIAQDRAGNVNMTEIREIRTEHFSNKVTVRRPLWREGFSYVLMNDIFSTDVPMEVTADGITFHMDNHTITGTDTGVGLEASDVNNLELRYGTIRSFLTGIDLENMIGLELEGMEVSVCIGDGIRIGNSEIGTLSAVDSFDNYGAGVLMSDCASFSVSNLTTDGNLEDGIMLTGSTGNQFFDILSSENGRGMVFEEGSMYNSMRRATLDLNDDHGLLLDMSSFNTISELSANRNGGSGIHTDGSNNNTFIDVVLSYNHNGISIQGVGGWDSNDLLTVRAENNDECGIRLVRSDRNLMDGITASKNMIGLFLTSSNNNDIYDVWATGNEDGIYLDGSDQTGLERGTSDLNDRGIVLISSSDSRIGNYTVTMNQEGIVAEDGSNYNTIVNCDLSSNAGPAVRIDSALSWGRSKGNQIYHNVFIDNNGQGVQANDNGRRNRWNHTRYGNYWSDWTSPDSEPNGIVDYLYDITGEAFSKDFKPLVEPLGPVRLYAPLAPFVHEDEKFEHKCYVISREEVQWHFSTNADWLDMLEDQRLIGIPGNSEVGSYWANVSITLAQGGEMWSNFTVTVLNTNDPPVITNSPPSSIDEDEMYHFKMEAEDIDPSVDTLEWGLEGRCRFLEMDPQTGTLTGTPGNDDVGTYDVDITVSDGNGGTDSIHLTLNVENENDPPVITTTDVTSATEDRWYEAIYSAYDIDPTGDVLTWSLGTVATFLSIDSETGTLSGTPTNDDVGNWSVNVSVDDGNGGIAFNLFTIRVENVNDPPVLTPVDLIVMKEDETYRREFQAVDVDPDGEYLVWLMETEARFIELDIESGVLTGMPDNEDVGEWWARIYVQDLQGELEWLDVRIIVENLNDPPSVTVSSRRIEIDEDGRFQNLDLKEIFYDVDGDELDISFDESDLLDISLSPDGWVTLAPITDWHGTEEVRFIGSDGKRSTDFDLYVTVRSVNDLPRILDVQRKDEYRSGEVHNMRCAASDPDLPYGDELTYVWWSNISGDVGEGSDLNTTLPVGYHSITVTVTDKGGLGDEFTFSIRVLGPERKKEDEGISAGTVLSVIVIVVILVLLVAVIVLSIIRLSGRSGSDPDKDKAPRGGGEMDGIETAPVGERAPLQEEEGPVEPPAPDTGHPEELESVPVQATPQPGEGVPETPSPAPADQGEQMGTEEQKPPSIQQGAAYGQMPPSV